MTTIAIPLPRARHSRQTYAVAGCYLVASFAALGLPPYLTRILPDLGDTGARWAGVLYVVPTIFSGLAAPVWGRAADRFGRKRLLLRAQLGLAAAFLLAGAARSIPVLVVALVLQGVLGGTFAASTGYLGATVSGTELSRALTLMQAAARAALVAAPVLVGALSAWISPHRQYLLFAVLPLAAALVVSTLPESRTAPARRSEEAEARSDDATAAGPYPGMARHARVRPTTVRQLCTLEAVFVFSTVVSFPYLLPLTQARVPAASELVSGIVFALPHLCYLVGSGLTHDVVLSRPHGWLAVGLLTVAVGLGLHTVVSGLAALVLARVVLGAGLTLGLTCLAVLAARCAADDSAAGAAGRLFGSVELWSKAGAVGAGLAAALAFDRLGPLAPPAVGGLTAILAAAFLALRPATPSYVPSHRSL